MKKSELQKWSKPEIHLSKNELSEKQKIKSMLDENKDIYTLSHNLTKHEQNKIKMSNLSSIVLGENQKPKQLNKKYCTFLIEKTNIQKLKTLSFKTGIPQSTIINNLIKLL